MPKIIENARELLLTEAKRRISESGYESLTVRELAKSCGLGLGTVYNYFPSKEMLIATLLLEEWTQIIAEIEVRSEGESDPMAVVDLLVTGIQRFMEQNEGLFHSDEAIRAFRGSVGTRHAMLRSQVAEPVYRVLVSDGYENAEMLSQFVGEAILHWTVEGKGIDELSPIISKLFIKKT